MMRSWGIMIAAVLTLSVALPAVGQEGNDEQARKEVREVVKRLQARY